MPLAEGTRLGSYQIVSALGAGGMGEVYRALDTKLQREVAIKVLPDVFARDRERLSRFEREARLLASLNHPNIANIYGIDETAGMPALVLELVEGPTLADLMAERRPNGLPVDEGLAVARQIANALEAAHEVGIVHRDLKPANIKVRPDGSVKVLDFGLAKASGPAAGSLSPGPARPSLLDSPTFTAPQVTEAGMILGTAAYMSPEQARGKAVDKRSDIWAFGVVLFEMLTGRAAFAGETVTDVLSAVISRDPDWTAIPGAVPAPVVHLLRRCLEKDHRIRLRDIGEARVLLSDASAGIVSVAPQPVAPARAMTRWLPWAVAAIALLAAAAMWWLRPAAQPVLRKLDLALPTDGRAFRLSPDGRHIAFRSGDHIVVTDLERRETRDLSTSPPAQRNIIFWSRDSAFVGYSDGDGRLWIVPATGGTPRQVCTIPETQQLMGAAWLKDGTIVFSVWRGSLYTVPATGGQPTALLTIDQQKEIDIHEVVEVPDGRVVVATHLAPAGGADSEYRVEVVGPSSRETVLGNGFWPMAFADSGHLLLTRFDVNRGLWAIPYTGRLPLRVEDAFLVAPAAQEASVGGGSLLYWLQSSESQMRELVWVDRSGQVVGQIGTARADLVGPALSRDAQQVAFSARTGGNVDVWVHNLQNGIQSRVTSEADYQTQPFWFSAARRLGYLEMGGVNNRIVSRNADGSGARQELGAGIYAALAPDDRHLAYVVDERGAGRLRYAALGAEGTIGEAQKVFTQTPEPDVRQVRFSPDGRLLAYVERTASGLPELFVTRFPSGEGRWQVSTGGGRLPVWSRSGELFFMGGATNGPKQMMVLPVSGNTAVTISSPVKLFTIPEDLELGTVASFDVTPDGQRFVMVRARSAAGQSAVRWVLVQNWLREFTEGP